MFPIQQTHPPPSPCAHVGLCRHCAHGSSSPSSNPTSSPSPSCPTPSSTWSSTVAMPLVRLPYLFTHSPAPAITFLTYPCKTISLMQGGQRPPHHPLHPPRPSMPTLTPHPSLHPPRPPRPSMPILTPWVAPFTLSAPVFAPHTPSVHVGTPHAHTP